MLSSGVGFVAGLNLTVACMELAVSGVSYLVMPGDDIDLAAMLE